MLLVKDTVGGWVHTMTPTEFPRSGFHLAHVTIPGVGSGRRLHAGGPREQVRWIRIHVAINLPYEPTTLPMGHNDLSAMAGATIPPALLVSGRGTMSSSP